MERNEEIEESVVKVEKVVEAQEAEEKDQEDEQKADDNEQVEGEKQDQEQQLNQIEVKEDEESDIDTKEYWEIFLSLPEYSNLILSTPKLLDEDVAHSTDIEIDNNNCILEYIMGWVLTYEKDLVRHSQLQDKTPVEMIGIQVCLNVLARYHKGEHITFYEFLLEFSDVFSKALNDPGDKKESYFAAMESDILRPHHSLDGGYKRILCPIDQLVFRTFEIVEDDPRYYMKSEFEIEQELIAEMRARGEIEVEPIKIIIDDSDTDDEVESDKDVPTSSTAAKKEATNEHVLPSSVKRKTETFEKPEDNLAISKRMKRNDQ
ncbi:unnamed protein product [Caenorhabditis bovis]|uniref:Uncharacterized protein n=1 Tax=Caenorhabditis bovis TaxID=2654633 RepID=A0A8S1EHS1_9PELO|nr:unnamed protein product [Caenorhabditis bovis]